MECWGLVRLCENEGKQETCRLIKKKVVNRDGQNENLNVVINESWFI
jgi:hypothetical protein